MVKGLNKVDVSFSVAGQSCYLTELTLNQSFNAHHTFEAIVDYEELDDKWMESPGKIIQLIGQDVNIEMKHKDGSGINLFSGIVTNISFVGWHGQQNHVCIQGASPTIRLDGTKTMDSFVDKDLSAIVSEAVDTSGNGGSVVSSPVFAGSMDYMCQYEETAFEFLNRLSWHFGEWFFYDGTTCYFGKPSGKESDSIMYDTEMTEFALNANMHPSKMKRYHYLVHDDKEIDKEAPENVPGVSGYHQVAFDMSSSVYTSEAVRPAGTTVSNLKELEDLTKAEKTRTAAKMLTMSGKTQTSKVKIGKTITILLPKSMETSKKEVGKFLVTDVTHFYTQKGEYMNSFTAIPADMENIPMEPVTAPKAYPQIATVKTNADENSAGRIKVEFQWQKEKNKTTNWIRVQTPDAGMSDMVPKNRGFVFIPEEDDIVMIDFEYGDPSRPYVSGSIFSEKVGEGGDDDNKIKSITTRTGSTIRYDESEGSITIKDKHGSDSTIVIDGEKNIAITAASSISLTSGKANITLMSEGDGTILVSAKTIQVTAEESYGLQSGKTISLNSEDTLSANSKSKSTFSSSKETIVSGQTRTTVTATGQTIIDGAIVKIN